MNDWTCFRAFTPRPLNPSNVNAAEMIRDVGDHGICLAPTERRWERGVYAASTHDCQQATDCSNALLLFMLKRRERSERRAPLYTYGQRPSQVWL